MLNCRARIFDSFVGGSNTAGASPVNDPTRVFEPTVGVANGAGAYVAFELFIFWGVLLIVCD